ncbi:hypothetical protein MSG37_07225 [Shewanella sp. 1CM18E]|uniref:hypothetical protein n=1 Tax=Shewanella sp. 1CM18E TaxID=2929169 RepID=UPI0020BFA1E1|nr:hypothetical protein [Shewanella sp. 1CM18E]MCK8044671.1 hypothetical protein [Shewanella sp. 1CM18E]
MLVAMRDADVKVDTFNYDLSRAKKNVEGRGSETAVTFSGPKSPMDIFKALMDVNPSNTVQSKRKL